MGLCISMHSSNSKVKPSSETPDISMSLTLIPPPNSIQTSRELNPAPMSKPTWRKTETSLIMEFSKSMEDQLEEVAKLPTTHMPRQSTQGPKLRPSKSLGS
ncbi:AC4 protein [Cotton leaf curl Alabad virus]|uniref:AC4 protein n=1 Tax=Cotton leaf curl Allahabad virus [India:Karnal:OY81B:2005] TaxID=908136 RepID=E7BNJ2_9GEMI|nr:AC4 protein [Cotton leaf curl Allahabad virus [India:Karnal:OY81B:2005]]